MVDNWVDYWTHLPWMAIRADSVERVIEPTGLTNFSPISWNDGVTAAHDRLFVSPVMEGWVLLVGDIDAVLDEYFKRRTIDETSSYEYLSETYLGMCEMSLRFKNVQIFHRYPDGCFHFYAKAIKGKIVRSYLLNGEKNILSEIGQPNAFEIHHGACFDREVVEAASLKGRNDMERFIPRMAGRWSINPEMLGKPKWAWLKDAKGLVYNGQSKRSREIEEWLKGWKKDFAETLSKESNGTKMINWSQ